MAYTVSETSFQTALGLCADFIAAEDWPNAHKQYAIAETLNAGLSVEARQGSASVRRREALDGVARSLKSASEATSRTADTRRFVKTHMGLGS